jgi:hypothetical protein
MLLRTTVAGILVAGLAAAPGATVDDGDAALLARIGAGLYAADNVCGRMCRTDQCTGNSHDIVDAVEEWRNANSAHLEVCGEYAGGCFPAHSCGGPEDDELQSAIEEFCALSIELKTLAVRAIPRLVVSTSGGIIHVIGCRGEVIANVPIAPSQIGARNGRIADRSNAPWNE